MSIDNNAVKLVQMSCTCFVNLFSAWNLNSTKKLKSAKWIRTALQRQKGNDKSKAKHTQTIFRNTSKVAKRFIRISKQHMQCTHTHTHAHESIQPQWIFRFMPSLWSGNRPKKTHTHTRTLYIPYSLASRWYFFSYLSVLHCSIHPPYEFSILFDSFILLRSKKIRSHTKSFVVHLFASFSYVGNANQFTIHILLFKAIWNTRTHTKTHFYWIVCTLFPSFVLNGFDLGQK